MGGDGSDIGGRGTDKTAEVFGGGLSCGARGLAAEGWRGWLARHFYFLVRARSGRVRGNGVFLSGFRPSLSEPSDRLARICVESGRFGRILLDMRNAMLIAVAMGCVAGVGGVAGAAGFRVDGFEQGPLSLSTLSGTNGTGADIANADSLGSRRSVTLFQSSGGTGNMVVENGRLRGWNDGGGTNVTVAYGWRHFPGSGAGLTGLTTDNLNISIAGTDRIRFSFSELTGFLRIFATLNTDTPNGAGQGFLSNGNAGNPVARPTAAGDFDLLFSDLRVPNNTNPLDYSNVDRVQFVFQVGFQSSFTLDGIGFSYALVPEPAAIGWLGAAGVVLMGRRRRRW